MIDPHISGKAFVLTGGIFDSVNAKTAHGLVRSTYRFDVQAVIDPKFAGQDAGDLLEGKTAGIPIVSSFQEAIQKTGGKPDFVVLGVAFHGGRLPESFHPQIEEVLSAGVGLVNGLHENLSDHLKFAQLAVDNHAILHDIRRVPSLGELHFWEGRIQAVDCKKVAVLGTDCALGKRTTTKFLEEELKRQGRRAEMIFTGQTGWMQGLRYGFIFDVTPNDFVSGEIEHAIVSCWEETQPEVILIEGQASLRNPSGPCGSEFIISGRMDAVILQHIPARTRFHDHEDYPAWIPDPLDEAELIQKLGSQVIAFSINSQGMDDEAIENYRMEMSARTNLPVVFPLLEGVEKLATAILSFKGKYGHISSPVH